MALGLLITLTWALPSRPQAETGDLIYLINLAMQHNPSLQAAEAEWERTTHGILPAKSLDDPGLALSFLNYPVDSPRFNRTPMTGNEIRLSQKLPFPGKLVLRGKIQEKKAFWRESLYEEKKLQLARQIKDAYYRYLLQKRTLAILDKNRALLDDLVRTLEAQYATGRGTQQQVFTAQQQLGDLMNRILAEQQKQATVYAEIEALTATRKPPITASVDLPPAHSSLPDAAVAISLADKQRPMMAAYRALIDQYRYEKELAVLNERPDFNLWVGYRFRDDGPMDAVDGADFISAGVSFNLPLNRTKRRAEQAAAASGVRQASAALDNYRDQVHFNISEALRGMRLARQQQQLYDSALLPQARQTWQAAINSFQVGETDYQQALVALLQLSNRELAYQQFIIDFYRNQAWYEQETGTALQVLLKGVS
jgi:outer membrane protein TolC